MLLTYKGSCHCGAVRFEADLDLTQPTYRCNCSICRRTRFWPAVARESGFRLLAGEQELTQYLFNSRKNQHYFCRHCGVRPFGIGTETPIGKMYGASPGVIAAANRIAADTPETGDLLVIPQAAAVRSAALRSPAARTASRAGAGSKAKPSARSTRKSKPGAVNVSGRRSRPAGRT
jgi:hypothetical protein